MTAFPARLPEKLKAIRARSRLSPNEFAQRVGAQSGAEILSYENLAGLLADSKVYSGMSHAGLLR